MSFYDEGKYGVITRKWFGLSTTYGGDAAVAASYAFGTHTATMLTHLARWYPRGPIKILKAGWMVTEAVTNASGGVRPVRFLTRGASASALCTITPASCTQAQYSFSSTTTFTVNQCKAGEYLTIKSGTARTLSSTATAVRATTAGAVAFFVDYKPRYDPKWSA